jgi:type I restriction-modification system DNA methylase subunit
VKEGLASVPERNIQIELYRILQNIIAKKFSVNDVEFTSVRYEPTINGRPDLVVEAIDKGKKLSLLVIETKRKVPFIDRKFDPYSKDVIKQASGYAVDLGAPYFATCNGDVLVLFDTFTAGVPLPQRRLKHYKVAFDEEFGKTLLEEVCQFRIGVGKWLELDDVFLQRLRTFHTFITPYMLESLTRQLRSDLKFKEKYVAWLSSQLFEYSPKMNETIAEQLAYMLMNRLMFYKTLETQISDLEKLRKIETEDPKEFSNRLRGIFDKVCKNIDYEAIFQPHEVLDQILLHKTLIYTLNDFIEELGTYDLAKIRSDVIGRVYEELIPDVERHRLGQYYTPPPIIELITEMCIKSPDNKILDPACGSGGFLVKSYYKLKNLKKKENPFADEGKLHEEILNQIYGIDINPFPAQLSSINLAVRNLKVTSRNINLVVRDFFKVKLSEGIIPNELDAIVTNPPYTRQEEMEYKDPIREEALTYSDGSKIPINAQAGIYAYFFTHSAKFLKNTGRMGYITSNTWLDVSFGEGLKQFFLDHFKLLALVEFDAAVFGTALVNTCVSIMEKEEALERRCKNLVRFVRVKKAIEIGKMINVIASADEDYENEQIRIVTKAQKTLQPNDRWGKYIRAPRIYFKIVSHPSITRLSSLAKLKRGFVTGFNDFFILDKGTISQWKIEADYLKPIVTSIRNIKGVEISEKDITEWVLMIHEPKGKLEGKNVLKYLEHGEEIEISTKYGTRMASAKVKGVNNLKTCKQRTNWYDLGEHDPPPIIAPYLMWDRVVFAHNKAHALAPNTLHFVYPAETKNIQFLLGVMNSTLTAFLLEIEGRSYGGGVLKMEAYEMAELSIIDPMKISKKDKERIEYAFSRLSQAQENNDSKFEEKIRVELDNAVFDALNLKEKEQQQIYEGLKSLRNMRLQRKEVDILVETAEKWKPHKKTKKEKTKRVEPSKRLDLWTRDTST